MWMIRLAIWLYEFKPHLGLRILPDQCSTTWGSKIYTIPYLISYYYDNFRDRSAHQMHTHTTIGHHPLNPMKLLIGKYSVSLWDSCNGCEFGLNRHVRRTNVLFLDPSPVPSLATQMKFTDIPTTDIQGSKIEPLIRFSTCKVYVVKGPVQTRLWTVYFVCLIQRTFNTIQCKWQCK